MIFTVNKGSSSGKGVYSRFGISHIRNDSILRDRIISSLGKGKDANMVLVDLNRPDLIPSRLDNIVENLIWASESQPVLRSGALNMLSERRGYLTLMLRI